MTIPNCQSVVIMVITYIHKLAVYNSCEKRRGGEVEYSPSN